MVRISMSKLLINLQITGCGSTLMVPVILRDRREKRGEPRHRLGIRFDRLTTSKIAGFIQENACPHILYAYPGSCDISGLNRYQFSISIIHIPGLLSPIAKIRRFNRGFAKLYTRNTAVNGKRSITVEFCSVREEAGDFISQMTYKRRREKHVKSLLPIVSIGVNGRALFYEWRRASLVIHLYRARYL